jgi:hypothetical protein
MTNTSYLRIPMHMLRYEVSDVGAFNGIPAEKMDLLWRDYTDDEIQNIIAALQFAVDHPDFDFSALDPQLNRSNAEIHAFLCKIHASICLAVEARARASR